mmetsp:Transcript_124400/g.185863  ORF Transcript_124400/g.185863 Transcript_124400/m.185863 type:complete len:102 (-) Transcript_124400:178-483(-)
MLFAVVPVSALRDWGDSSFYNSVGGAGYAPLRGTPTYPVGHPGYFNGVGGGPATDSYGTYALGSEGQAVLRGSPAYPVGHPGYFNGVGGGAPTDSYGTWAP